METVTVDSSCTLVIASVQSLHENRLWCWSKDMFDGIIFDEGHHLTSPTWKMVQNHFNTNVKFAFSATLDVTKIDYNLLYSKSLIEMMQKGFISPVEHIKIDVKDKGIYLDSTYHDELILSIISKYPNEKILVFCASLDQAQRLGQTIEASYCLTSLTPINERREIVKRYSATTSGVLFNFLIVHEGFDDPGSTMVIAKHTLSKDLYIQTTGRVLRLSENKVAKVVDLVIDDKQMTLPILFGLHHSWDFLEAPLDDAIKAIAFADEHKLDISQYPNWGFLQLKKTYRIQERKPARGIRKSLKAIDSDLKIISQTANYVKVATYGGSRFYSAEETIARTMKENLDRALSFQPVKHIDSNTVEVKKAETIDIKRLRALKYIRKYGRKNRFLKDLYYKSAKRPLSESQCDVAIRIGKEFAAMDMELEDGGMNDTTA